MVKSDSYEDPDNNFVFKVYTTEEVQKLLPKRIKEANDLLELKSDDDVMSVLRYFDWSMPKLKAEWFENQENLKYKIGIEYDKSLKKKYPDIDDSTAAKNNNMCQVMYCEFEDPAKDPNADPDMAAVSLICGHQFSAVAWSE